MKTYFLSLVACLMLTLAVYAQPQTQTLPPATAVVPYKLQVGLHTTTVLIFPVAIISGDRGYSDISVQREKEVDNVLKVKAAVKNFQPTNLHVYTKDGRVYPFTVEYVEYPVTLTYNLGHLQGPATAMPLAMVPSSQASLFEIAALAQQAKEAKPFLTNRTRGHGLQLRLRTIHTRGEVLLFAFTLTNRSKLAFATDFVRLYTKDKHRAKRSSVQEQETQPLYQDSLATLGGQSETVFVLAVPRFTIPDKKEFFVALFEKNGGRHLHLRIGNLELLNAKPL